MGSATSEPAPGPRRRVCAAPVTWAGLRNDARTRVSAAPCRLRICRQGLDVKAGAANLAFHHGHGRSSVGVLINLLIHTAIGPTAARACRGRNTRGGRDARSRPRGARGEDRERGRPLRARLTRAVAGTPMLSPFGGVRGTARVKRRVYAARATWQGLLRTGCHQTLPRGRRRRARRKFRLARPTPARPSHCVTQSRESRPHPL